MITLKVIVLRRMDRVLLKICAFILAKSQASGVANSVVSTVVCDLEELTTWLHSQIKQEALSVMPMSNPTTSAIQYHFENFENPFASFNTNQENKVLKPSPDVQYLIFFPSLPDMIPLTEIYL
jgi:hypothetical protein